MDLEFILIQLIGLMGNAAVIAGMQFNNRKIVLASQALACLLWVVHYGALGAVTAVYINFIAFARSVVFYFNTKPWAKSKVWLWLFMGAFIANSLFTWENWISIMPAIGMCASTCALWTQDKRRLRALYLTSSPPWLIYNAVCGSYSGTIVELFSLASYIIAIYRFDIKKTAKEED